MLSLGILPTGITLAPATTSILVSWTAPQFYTPDSYSVTISCMRLCDNVQTFSRFQPSLNGGATSYNFTSLDPGNNCTVRVAAMLSFTSSESGPVSANTLTEGNVPYDAMMFVFTISLQLLMVLLQLSFKHQSRAGHSLYFGDQFPAKTREDPSLDTDCATAMAPPL